LAGACMALTRSRCSGWQRSSIGHMMPARRQEIGRAHTQPQPWALLVERSENVMLVSAGRRASACYGQESAAPFFDGVVQSPDGMMLSLVPEGLRPQAATVLWAPQWQAPISAPCDRHSCSRRQYRQDHLFFDCRWPGAGDHVWAQRASGATRAAILLFAPCPRSRDLCLRAGRLAGLPTRGDRFVSLFRWCSVARAAIVGCSLPALRPDRLCEFSRAATDACLGSTPLRTAHPGVTAAGSVASRRLDLINETSSFQTSIVYSHHRRNHHAKASHTVQGHAHLDEDRCCHLPHVYPHRQSAHSFLSTRQEAIALAKGAVGYYVSRPSKTCMSTCRSTVAFAMHLGAGRTKGSYSQCPQAAIDTFKTLKPLTETGKTLNTTEKLQTLSRHWQEVKRRGVSQRRRKA
jgi:hypothetical protein